MKVLIWFLCVVVASVIPVLFSYRDVILGGIPTLLLWCGTFWLAKTLCKKWDDHKSKKVSTHIENPAVYTESDTKHIENNKINFCRKCGERLIPGGRFCNKCGTEVIEESGQDNEM